MFNIFSQCLRSFILAMRAACKSFMNTRLTQHWHVDAPEHARPPSESRHTPDRRQPVMQSLRATGCHAGQLALAWRQSALRSSTQKGLSSFRCSGLIGDTSIVEGQTTLIPANSVASQSTSWLRLEPELCLLVKSKYHRPSSHSNVTFRHPSGTCG